MYFSLTYFFRLGEACNHIGALIHALVDVTDKKKDGLLASTSIKCAWNNPRKRRLSPKKTCELPLRKSKVGTSNHDNFKATANETRFRERLLSFKSTAGWLTNFEKIENVSCLDQNTTLVNKITRGIPFMYHDSTVLSSDDVVKEFSDYNISKEECDSIEINTRGQAGNSLWNLQRQGRITSSNFGYVYFRKETTPLDG